MGKQSHCLLFCFLLCWERLAVIDFSQSWPGRVEASGRRSHQWPHLNTNTHTHTHPHTHTHTHSWAQSHRASPLRRTPLPLSLSRPCQFLSQCVYLKYADEAFVVPCPSLDAHSFGLRSIMAWARGGSSAHHAYTHTKTHAQHSWGHSLSTSGARLLPLQPDKSPHDTQKKAPGPQRERGPVPSSSSNLCSVTSNASELLLPYSHWIWTKGRKEDEGKESGEKKKEKAKRERWEERKGWVEERDI